MKTSVFTRGIGVVVVTFRHSRDARFVVPVSALITVKRSITVFLVNGCVPLPKIALLVASSLGYLIWIDELRYPTLIVCVFIHLSCVLFMNVQLFGWTMIVRLLLFADSVDMMGLHSFFSTRLKYGMASGCDVVLWPRPLCVFRTSALSSVETSEWT